MQEVIQETVTSQNKTSDQICKNAIEKIEQQENIDRDNKLIEKFRSLGAEYPKCAEALMIMTDNKNLIKEIFDISNSVAQSRRSKNGKTFEEIIRKSIPEKYKGKIGLQEQIRIDHTTGRFVKKEKDGYKGREDLIPYNLDIGEYQANDKISIIISIKTTLRERFKQDFKVANSVGKEFLVTMGKKNDVTLGKIEEMIKNNITPVIPSYIDYPSNKNWKKIRNLSITLEDMWNDIYKILTFENQVVV